MWRTLMVLLAGAVALGACGGGGDDDTAPASTDAPATAVEATTTSTEESPLVAGLLTPPEGVPQDAADGFAADLVVAMDDAGWPSMERQESIDILQGQLDLAWTACRLVSSLGEAAPGLDGAERALDVDGTRADLVGAYVDSGVPEATAGQLVDGMLRGTFEAAGVHLCPENAEALGAAAASL